MPIAYDEELAERVREQLAPDAGLEERKMFGGLAFMVNTHLACGIMKDDLMVRVGKEGHHAAIERGAREMEFTGRPMRSMVVVPGDALRTEQALGEWVTLAVEHARSEPPKPPQARRES